MERPDPRVTTALAALSTALLFVGLGDYGVVNNDEAIYHGIAERMVASGNWLQLDFRGEPRFYDAFMNAPLHYWARGLLIALLGSSLFTMRALSAAFGVLTVLATYALGCRLAGRRAGLLAALIQLTTFQFLYLHGARTGELDSIASFLVVAMCLGFLRAVEDGESFWPHHLAAAALLMTKLPLLLVPLAAEAAWLLMHPAGRERLPRYLRTAALLAPFALLWHAGQALADPAGAARELGAILQHAVHGEGRRLSVLGNARFYAESLLYGALPWGALYPAALVAARGRPRLRIAWLQVASVGVFFCLVVKHFPWYTTPALPFLAVLCGAWLAALTREGAPLGAALGAALAAVLWLDVAPLATNPFAVPALDFPMQWTARHWLGLGPLTAILLLGGVWAAVWHYAAPLAPWRSRIAWAAVIGLFAFAWLRVLAPLAYLEHHSPLSELHAEIQSQLAAGQEPELPIELGAAPPLLVRFYFGDDFEIAVTPRRGGHHLLALYPRGDPGVLERSIGRAGIEARLAALEAEERAPSQQQSGSEPADRSPRATR